MLSIRNTIEARNFCKKYFSNAEELKNFLDFAQLKTMINYYFSQNKKFPTLTEEYKLIMEKSPSFYRHLYYQVIYLPKMNISLRYGKEVHKEQRTPLNYLIWWYGNDEKRRMSLYK